MSEQDEEEGSYNTRHPNHLEMSQRAFGASQMQNPAIKMPGNRLQ